jgi:hypothetical protein
MKKNKIYTMNKIFKNLFWSIYAIALVPALVFADTEAKIVAKLDNPLTGVGSLDEFIVKILEIVTKIGTPIAILAVIYSGFLFVKAQGNEAELTKAKEAFFWTIVGVLVLLGAKVLGVAIGGTIAQIGG